MKNEPMRLHERLVFDLEAGQILDGNRRYVIMRNDVLMGAFDGLDEMTRARALQALGASVTRFGSDSVRAYRSEVGTAALLDTMVAGSASLGWGRWSFRAEHRRLFLEVHNSPFAAGTGSRKRPACAAIAGMLEAVGLALWGDGAAVQVTELYCACTDPANRAPCRFLAETAVTS